jgi:hypothetical protein
MEHGRGLHIASYPDQMEAHGKAMSAKAENATRIVYVMSPYGDFEQVF